MLRVAIIGLGDVSPVHKYAIDVSDNGELVAVCDVNEALKTKYPDVPFYTDVEAMLEKEDLDVVHICLPHYLHYPVTKLCVEKGVHVFQEKPLALDYEEGLKTLALAEESSKKIGVCFQNRYNETFLELKRLLADENVGAVTGVKGLVAWHRPETYYTIKPWRGQMEFAGGGSIINQAIHTLDLMQVLGGEIDRCKASLSNITDYDIEVEDTAVANFTFKNGARGFYMSTNAYVENSSVELQVITEKSKFTIKDNCLYRTNSSGEKELHLQDTPIEGTKFYYGPSHSALIQRFYNAIEADSDDYVTVRDALPAMLMIDAMKLSSKEKRTIEMEEIING